MEVLIKDFSFSYEGMTVLSDINLNVKNNDVLLILGHNGAGKSTLIKSILKTVSISDGKIFLDNIDVNNFKMWQQIGYVPQDMDTVGFPINVFEFLMCFNKSKKAENVTKILKELDIVHLKNRNINTLSGGEKRRVYIGRSLLNDIKLLILDEPITGVDAHSRDLINNTLKNFNKKNVPIIIITHNYTDQQKIATHVLLLEKKITFYGLAKDYELMALEV